MDKHAFDSDHAGKSKECSLGQKYKPFPTKDLDYKFSLTSSSDSCEIDPDMVVEIQDPHSDNYARQGFPEQRRANAVLQDELNEGSIEIIEDKLYFISAETPPVSENDDFYFNTDNLPELQYDPFHKDFGPLKLSMMHRYC